MKEATMLREGSSTLEIIEQFKTTRAEYFRQVAPVRDLRDDFKKVKAAPRFYDSVKRTFDFLLAFFGLLFSAPIWLAIMAAIKLTSPGPVFYFQERYGRGGKVFRQWKFRSMVADAEKQTGPVLASEKDPRITPVGWFLRKTAMDELPQLFNILVGDMSFVGPRPERPFLVENIILQTVPNFHQRHVIRPGLTGLAQVYGRYNTSPRDKLRYDLLYVENYSFFLDIRLIFISFLVTFRGKWQDRGRKF